jgi:ankyrin repeat protein
MAACYLDLGACVNASGPLYNDIEQRPLVSACKNGHEEVVNILLARCADTSQPVLEIAARQGHLTIVQMLLDHGAEIGDAISGAVAKGYMDIVKELLDHGANVTSGSRSMLVQAIEQEHEAMFRLLVDRGGASRDLDTSAECVRVAEEKGLDSMLKLLSEYHMSTAL